MAEGAFEFWIHPDRRAGIAVYAVAIGDHLCMELEKLKRLRNAVESSKLTGEEALDGILLFLRVAYDHNALGQLQEVPPQIAASPTGVALVEKAYYAVAPLVQPPLWETT